MSERPRLTESNPLPEDTSGITVTFYRGLTDMSTYVTFKIPDHYQVLSRSPEEFMQWCYEEMMRIATQWAQKVK